ncbi:MAG: bifunctional UDP-N-acetylglucosamine diphosphorylase/glucosamine-1-phosphate N-acetyltransferase GlmU [Bdellovibrionales bacterium]
MAHDKSKTEKTREFTSILLAAGKGTRMYSALPKVLHPVAGLPMIHRVIKAVRGAGATDLRVVVGYGENLVRQVTEPMGAVCYRQDNQLGTADAVRSADPETLEGHVLILNGDHPLIRPEHILAIYEEYLDLQCDFVVVSAKVKEPGELGRIVRHKGELKAIVEARDASADTLAIDEINTAIYFMKADVLKKFLPKIKNQNSKQEFYFTDMVSLCLEAGLKVKVVEGAQELAMGVNNQRELAAATKQVFLKSAYDLMDKGVVIVDPDNTYIEESVTVGASTVIYPGVSLRGKTKVGQFCVLENNSILSDAQLEDSVQVRAHCYIEKSLVKTKATVGPFARLRPDTQIGVEAHVGNFVEMKKVNFGDRSKAGHLTYLGDADVGKDTNIGCGTITCNYAADKKKYRTTIGDQVFVGSDTQFVAPVTIGDHAIIGSGSTITKNVPAKALAVARGKQVVKENYSPKAPSTSTEKKS